MNENVYVCITPKGEKPVLHFSQFDNGRRFTVTVLADDGETAAVLTGIDIEFRLRKTDSHVVTIAPESVADNLITFKTTEQMCACCGQNIASVVLMKDDMIISTLDILVDIQRDILAGGLTSESDIRNLTTQIEAIVPEVIGDDYYNKQEVDDLIASHTFDPTNYYNKSDVDGLLADKADASDVYTKTETDNLLADKADKSDTYTKSDVDTLLMDRMGNIEFTSLTPGAFPIYTFNSSYEAPLIDVKAAVTSSTNEVKLTSCGKSIFNFTGNLRSTASGFTISATADGAIHYQGTATTAYAQLTTSFSMPLKSGTTITFSRDKLMTYQHYIDLRFTDDTHDYVRIQANETSKSYTLAKDLKSVELICLGLTVGTAYDDTVMFMVELGSTATTIEGYRGETKTISLGQTVASGNIEFVNGIFTDGVDTIKFTPVTVDVKTGLNNIFIDCGTISTITYVSQSDIGLMELLNAYTKR